MKKRMISLLLLLALVVGICPAAFAAEDTAILSTEKKLALADALYGIEAQKELIGLADTDFSTLQIGIPVQTYIYYANDTFEPAHMLYPLMSDTNLVLWALDLNDQFQITTALVNEIRDCVDLNKSFTIIYDQSSSYLYTDEMFTLLKSSNIEDSSRGVLDPNARHNCQVLQTTALSGTEALNYKSYIARAQRYFSCNIKETLQLPYENLCWAAVTACISNYLKGTSLTAAVIGQNYYQMYANFDRTISLGEIEPILKKYNLPYTYKTQIPSDNVILTNIKNGYPVYSVWNVVGRNYHACCIYGIDIMNGYIYVMDPEFGFTSVAPSDSGYSYISGFSGATLKLSSAACNSWS